VGTLAYMAPEIGLQENVAPELATRADVYALGCIAFEMLTGEQVFRANSEPELLAMHIGEPPRAPSSLRPSLSREVDEAVLAALAKAPAERTASARQFREQLLRAMAGDDEPRRILVAEDEEDFRELLSTYLGVAFPNARVECVGDGASALAAFDRAVPDLVLLDLQMPGMDGTTVTEQLRARPGAARMPILVLTASGGPRDWKRLSALGADGFLLKPVNLEDVAALIRRALRERRGSAPPSVDPR